LIELRNKIQSSNNKKQYNVVLTYITARGAWYHTSWKGDPEKSGGIETNIGIHLFDLLLWLFGTVSEVRVYHSDTYKASGFLEMEKAQVSWFLSIDQNDLPFHVKPGDKSTYRSITIDGEELEFSDGFTGLHTRLYVETLSGNGFGIEDARPSIELLYKIRTAKISPTPQYAHPLLKR
jgi:UDP-N-acetyl-2-amino-2-deoxyglucuronate dehydrogenase